MMDMDIQELAALAERDPEAFNAGFEMAQTIHKVEKETPVLVIVYTLA